MFMSWNQGLTALRFLRVLGATPGSHLVQDWKPDPSLVLVITMSTLAISQPLRDCHMLGIPAGRPISSSIFHSTKSPMSLIHTSPLIISRNLAVLQ